MKKLSAIIKYQVPTTDELAKFEQIHQIKLPCDLKLFLVTQNILKSEESQYVLGEKIFEIHHFYPINLDSDLSLYLIYDALKDFFCGKYIPFADDSGGWQYVISLQELDKGKVYLCRMDESLGNGFTLVADSLTDFINGLTKPTKGPIA